MKTPIAWLNLAHQKTRTLVAVAGIAFAVILVFMQLGFLGSVLATATLLLRHFNFDILLVSPHYIDVNRAATFPRNRLYQAEAVEGVAWAAPVDLAFSFWRNGITRLRRNILVMGVDLAGIGTEPSERTVLFPELYDPDTLQALRESDTVLMDTLSREEFGERSKGVVTELGPRRVTVVGNFTLGTGFGSDGAVVTSDENFLRVFSSKRSRERISLGLVKLQAGADPEVVRDRLRALLSPAVIPLTRAEIESREEHHWVRKTSVGVIFGLGVAVSLVVGVIFVYQVISSDVRNHLSEFATLKAMGYSEHYLSGLVLQQAVALALLGYLPGLLLSLGLYQLTREGANIPIHMDMGRAVLVFGLTVLMCSASGLLSLQRVRSADPADLF
jgi:putative ABC transport system permease protein